MWLLVSGLLALLCYVRASKFEACSPEWIIKRGKAVRERKTYLTQTGTNWDENPNCMRMYYMLVWFTGNYLIFVLNISIIYIKKLFLCIMVIYFVTKLELHISMSVMITQGKKDLPLDIDAKIFNSIIPSSLPWWSIIWAFV